jgi:hypothetical protein
MQNEHEKLCIYTCMYVIRKIHVVAPRLATSFFYYRNIIRELLRQLDGNDWGSVGRVMRGGRTEAPPSH